MYVLCVCICRVLFVSMERKENDSRRKNTYEVTNLVNEIKVRRVSLLQQHMYMYGLNRNMY